MECDNLLIATIIKMPSILRSSNGLRYVHSSFNNQYFNALKKFGNTIIPAESGELASGLSGQGRMAEPENIIAFLEADLESKLPLKEKQF
jgi:phosphopantothenoylcysteine decarboxylase/phosphopantothenate--cysteine ligase